MLAIDIVRCAEGASVRKEVDVIGRRGGAARAPGHQPAGDPGGRGRRPGPDRREARRLLGLGHHPGVQVRPRIDLIGL
mgnify:FL=1